MLTMADRWLGYGLGFTALHFAAARGSVQVVHRLCEMSAQIETGTRPDQTAVRRHVLDHISELCVGCDCERSSYDWAKGPNANHEGEEAYCNLAWCLEHHDGISLPTPLHLAVAAGHRVTVKALLEHGANIHAKSHPSRALRPGRDCGCPVSTPLHWAVMFKQREIAEFLLGRGALPNSLGSDDWGNWAAKPLKTAVMGDDRDMTLLLLQHGADPSRWFEHEYVFAQTDEEGFATSTDDIAVLSPLHWAASKGDVHLGQILLMHGANVNITADDGWGPTPLDCALWEGQREMADFLRANGATTSEYDGG